MSYTTDPATEFARVYLTAVTTLVASAGTVIGIAGVWLIILAGTWYCAVAGLGLLTCAGLLGHRRVGLGVGLGAVIFAALIVWALREPSLSGWAQVPYLMGPAAMLVLVVLVIPVLRPLPRRPRAAGNSALDCAPT